jgi:hypothetical protein
MYSFLNDMRQRSLAPRIEIEGGVRMIVINHTDDDTYVRWLKAHKRFTLMEFDIETKLGIDLGALQGHVAAK